MDKIIYPVKSFKARLKMPGDAAISHRAAFVASLAEGACEIKNFSFCRECQATLSCLSELGVQIEKSDDQVIIHGKGLAGIEKPNAPINVADSPATARMLCGILAACDFESEITDGPNMASYPFKQIIEPLEKMGARIESDNFHLPLRIKGANLKGIRYAIPVFSSQVKGTLLLAGLLAEGQTEIIERIPSRDHLERLLAHLGVKITKSKIDPKSNEKEDPLAKRFKKASGMVSADLKGNLISLEGRQKILPKSIVIPGDLSAAAYFLAAGLLADNSEVSVENVSLNPSRMGFIEILKKMKVPITVEQTGEYGFELVGNIHVKSMQIKGRRIVGEVIPSIIDELPIMAVVASMADGTSVIRDAFELRLQRIDRIKAIASNLRKMGVKVGELDDGLAIDGGNGLKGAQIDTFGDHRIAMSFAIAGLLAKGETVIKDAECVQSTYPGFWDDFDRVFAN